MQTRFTAGFGVSGCSVPRGWADHIGARRMFVGPAGRRAWPRWRSRSVPAPTRKRSADGPQGLTLGRLLHAGDHARRATTRRRPGVVVAWAGVLSGMSAGYVGSISLAIGLIALFDYRVGFCFVVSGHPRRRLLRQRRRGEVEHLLAASVLRPCDTSRRRRNAARCSDDRLRGPLLGAVRNVDVGAGVS